MTRFKAPVEYRRTTDGRDGFSLSRFAGMPVGAQLFSDWQIWYNPFLNQLSYDATNNWTLTQVAGLGAAALSDDVSPGHLAITNAAADNDETQIQFTAANGAGEFIDPTTNRAFFFETLIQLDDANDDTNTVDQVDWFVGLGVTDTTFMAGAADFIGFHHRDITDVTTGAIAFVSGTGGGGAGNLRDKFVQNTGWVSTGTTGTVATDRSRRIFGPTQWAKFSFLVEPRTVATTGFGYAWVNDEPIAAVPMNLAANIPTTQICPTLCIRNGEGVIKILRCAYLLVGQNYTDTSDALLTS